MPSSRTACLAACLALAAAAPAAAGDLHPTSLPQGLLAQTDSVIIAWSEALRCQLELGPAPDALSPLAGAAGGPGRLAFVPAALGLGAGVWAARLVSLDGESSSLPFTLIVESATAPNLIAPGNGSELEPGGVQLRWEPVLGVPYYHVLFSDQEILIEENAEGDPVIVGASLIWQAITPSTAIAYGAADPSGVFTAPNGNAPPLVAGPEYNWLVLNNYGNNPALTSTRQAGVAAFRIALRAGLAAPELLAPAAGDSLAAPALEFAWTVATGASHYQFTLTRIVDEDGNEGAVSVFEQVTSQTQLSLPAADLLVDSRYRWKVYALDATGQGAASSPREFHYRVAMGQVTLYTQDGHGQPLPYVQVVLTPLGGGGSALPVITGSSGGWEEELVAGAYRVEASKGGHETASAEFSLDANGTCERVLVLPASPATLAGGVRDTAGQPFAHAQVRARNLQTGELRLATSTAGGAFSLGVTPGQWGLRATAAGYQSADSLLLSAQAGAYQTLPAPLHLAPSACSLAGSVRNTGGQPILAATVTVAGAEGSQSALTGADGNFQFNLAAGSWTLTASKPGYVPPAPRPISLAPGQQLSLAPPLGLDAQAAILSGYTRGAAGVVGGALVTATPASGLPRAVTANAQGAWLLSLPAGTWTLTASKAGYSGAAPLQLTLAAGAEQSGLALLLVADPCAVSGQVTDGTQPLAGATVSAGAATATSAWDGGFSLTLAAGEHRLEAFRTGYTSAAVLLSLALGQTVNGVALALTPGAATVSGRVLAEGAPVAGALLQLAGPAFTAERTSGAAGDFAISAPPGAYTLSASKSCFIAGAPLALTLAAGQTLPGQDLLLTPAGARLAGRVVVAGSGAALGGALLAAASAQGDFTTSSAADGSWALLLPGGQNWALSALKSGHATATAQTPLLADGSAWSGDFALSPQAAALGGCVRDESGLALAGLRIALRPSAGDSLQCLTDAAGRYAFACATGPATLSVGAPGYAPYSSALALPDGASSLDIVLDARFARLAGSIRDGEGAPLAGVLLTVSGAASGSALSDATGAFLLPRLLAGASTLSASKLGYAPLSQSLALAEEEDAALSLALERLLGTLAGRVLDSAGAGLGGASLQLRAGAALVAQTLSAANGDFALGGLDPLAPLDLYLSLAGHSVLGGNPLRDLLPGGEPLLLRLVPDDGRLRGSLTSATDGAPVAGALVSAVDGAGVYAETRSDAGGAFAIGALPRASLYTLHADGPGWAALSVAGLAPDGAPLALSLEPAGATVYGSLVADTPGSGRLPLGSALQAIPAEGGPLRALALSALGEYSLEALPPGDFLLVCRVDGCLTLPRQQSVRVDEGQVLGPYDFELVPTPLASLAISGLEELEGGQSAIYQGAQRAADGESLDYPLIWSLEPPGAGTFDTASGRFAARADFLGTATLRARHAASGLGAARAVTVGARLTPQTARALDDGAGLRLRVPAGALGQATRIGLRRETPTPLKRRAGSYRVEGELYRFLPSGLAFADSAQPTLTLPVPNPLFNERLALGWWDPSGLAWTALPGTKGTQGLSRALAHFSDYALLVANAPLGVGEARLSANPFSPALAPLELRFTVSSQTMAAPLVDVEVFNLLGDPVCRLLRRQALAVGVEHRLAWDGLTQAGELARNGRYLLRIRVEDGGEAAERILQVVLVK